MTFVVPPRHPAPREHYRTEGTTFTSKPGTWPQTHVRVWEMYDDDPEAFKRPITEYDRNYRLGHTFEPFRQLRDGAWGDYALVSPDYTATSVMDLATGEVIAGEEPHGAGFCPVGFYVPDYWDVHDGSIEPGSKHWDEGNEWPVGDFGFVWGCHWGDDTSWKVQYLDLSGVVEGRLTRDDRFGYVELATGAREYPPPFISVDPPEGGGSPRVTFAVRGYCDLNGTPERTRLRLRSS